MPGLPKKDDVQCWDVLSCELIRTHGRHGFYSLFFTGIFSVTLPRASGPCLRGKGAAFTDEKNCEASHGPAPPKCQLNHCPQRAQWASCRVRLTTWRGHGKGATSSLTHGDSVVKEPPKLAPSSLSRPPNPSMQPQRPKPVELDAEGEDK